MYYQSFLYNISYGSNVQNQLYLCIGTIFIIIDIVIQTSLISILFREFHKMSAKYYAKKLPVAMDNRSQEKIVEMTRYLRDFCGAYTMNH